MSDSSDSEFEKFLQESLSSSLESSFSKDTQFNSNKVTGAIGLNWMKSSSLPQDDQDLIGEEDEWIAELPEAKSTSKRKISTASEDPLNFSTGSGYSILSEIEHQLGLRGSKSPPAGQDTLNEENEKRMFFEQFEKGRGSSLNYSELNKQLNDTLEMSTIQKSTIALNEIPETIDEDITPHVSDNEPEQEDTQLPTFKYKTGVSSHSSLSSSSHQNTLLSSTKQISSKLVPILDNTVLGTEQRKVSQTTISVVSPNQDNNETDNQATHLTPILKPTGNNVVVPAFTDDISHINTVLLDRNNEEHFEQQPTKPETLDTSTSVRDTRPSSSSSSNLSLPLTQIKNSDSAPFNNVIMATVPSTSEVPSSQLKDELVPTEVDNDKVNQDRSLNELLKVLAVEELTALSNDMLSKDDAEEPIANDILQQEIDKWKQELEMEKNKVKEMENKILESIRKEEKMQLEHGRQMQELRKQVLDQRAMLRSLEEEKKSVVKPTNTDEQERLIQGYQKENERLYHELSITSKELKSTKTKLLEDNNKLATELANMKAKCETQDATIRNLRQQLDTHPYLLQEDDERVRVIEEKLQESQEHCNELQKQVHQLLHTKQTLEKQMISLKYKPTEETEEMKQKYEEKIKILQEKLENSQNTQKDWKDKNDLLLHEIEMLKTMHGKKDSDDRQTKGPRLIKSRTAADLHRIKELEHQVNELQMALQRRHPNSISALIYATSCKESESRDVVTYLEKKVQSLETELAGKENETASKLDDMKRQFHDMTTTYEQQIESLKEQVTVAEEKFKQFLRKGSASKKEESLESQNAKLNDQISQLSLEITHQKLQLKALSAEAEGERRKLNEKWEKKVKRLEKENAEKMDTLVVNLIQERSDSNITRLKTRLIARETRIKQLEEELDIARIDGETIAISRTVEEDLRNQIDVLTQELEDSKKHHTPEMHHFNTLLAKISHLESKLVEYQKQLQETKDKSGQVSHDQLKNIELKYRRQLTEKNKQIEKFREELDTLMDTLHSLHESNEVIQK